MSKLDRVETFETSPFFERYGQAFGNVVAGSLLTLGLANCVDEVLDVRAAENSELCIVESSSECRDLVSSERSDALRSSIGGLGMMTMLGGLTIMISRKEKLQ